MANFNVKIGSFNVAVEDLSEKLTPDEFLKEFVKDTRPIFWSDCDCRHFFMDFILCKKDNKSLWCQSKYISNDFTIMAVLVEAL